MHNRQMAHQRLTGSLRFMRLFLGRLSPVVARLALGLERTIGLILVVSPTAALVAVTPVTVRKISATTTASPAEFA